MMVYADHVVVDVHEVVVAHAGASRARLETVAVRDRAVTGVAGGGIHDVASTEAPSLWYPAKLDAMEGRMLAESIRIDRDAPSLWYPAKLDAMEGRMLAESVRLDG